MNTEDNQVIRTWTFTFFWVLSLISIAEGATLSSDPFLPKWNPKQCVFWEDALGSSEASKRLLWARRCAPDYEAYYRYAEKHSDPGRLKQILYPVFGVSDEEGKAVKNPLGYFPPSVDMAPERDCDLPQDYEMVGMCESFPDL